MSDTTAKSISFTDVKQLYRFIWRLSSAQQVRVCLIALLTLPLTLIPVELQRRIIDDAVGGSDVQLLLWLVGIYGGVIVAQQITKYGYNYYQGRLSESVIQHLREKILADVDPDAEKDDEGTVVAMISGEVEPIGGFAGSAFAQLVTEGGVLIVVFAYMLYTEFWLALIAIAVFIPQALATPFVQNHINVKAAKRVTHVRSIGDDVVAISRGNEKRSEQATTSIQHIFNIRLTIVRLKFLLKAFLNLFDHLADLAVLGCGGYMVIIGESDIGVVVAFLSGLNHLRSPWRTLINYFRVASNAQLQFNLLKEQLPDGYLVGK